MYIFNISMKYEVQSELRGVRSPLPESFLFYSSITQEAFRSENVLTIVVQLLAPTIRENTREDLATLRHLVSSI